jgi:predicted nucleic acid-binding protein
LNLFVDTSVWSLALRRDLPSRRREVAFLAEALEAGESIFTTGLVLQELLQGLRGPKAREAVVERFAVLPFVVPSRQDHIDAAALHGVCRRKGIQATTIDVLLAQLCLRHELTLLTTDADFRRISNVRPLSVWTP